MDALGHLYHYQRFKTEWLERIVHDSKVHCAGPRDFNDPWDCRPCYGQSILDDSEKYIEHVAFFDRVDRKHGPAKTEEQRAQQLEKLSTDPSFLKSLLRDMMGIDRPIHERFRVLCLSAKPDSVVMWSHYADKHRGICLEFSTDNEEFSGAYKVEYCQKYPSYNLTDQSLEHNLLPLVTKSAEWSYECEYRVIAEEHTMAASTESLHTHGGFLSVPPDSLKSVILGCEIDDASRNNVRDRAAQRSSRGNQASRPRAKSFFSLDTGCLIAGLLAS
jgi:Protein of unknown function (DUF2971)